MKKQTCIITLMALALLSATPALAQRHGSGSRGGGARGGVSHSTSRPSSSPSRSYTTPTSRPSSSYSTSRSYNSPSTNRPSSRTETYGTTRPYSSTPRSSSSAPRDRVSTTRPGGQAATTGVRTTTSDTRTGTASYPTTTRPGSYGSRPATMGGVTRGGAATTSGPVRFGSRPPAGGRAPYASPAFPRHPLPPSHFHLRPAPFFYHPIYHSYIHMRPLYWDPFLPTVVYWPGLWSFCVGYWAGTVCSDYAMVHNYVQETHHVDMLGYVISGDLMYALVDDGDQRYLRVFDKADNLLAQHPVSDKYQTITLDNDNGGCWIMKKRDKDPLLFLFSEGELLIYETD